MPLLKINSFTGFGEHGAFDRAWYSVMVLSVGLYL